jgi:hypothetical protein
MQRREKTMFLQYEKKKKKKFYLTSTHKETLSCLCIYLKETGCTAKLRKIFHSIFSFWEVEESDFLQIKRICIRKTIKRKR